MDGIDLPIGKGEYVLVCGANGSGKSTLACLLNGLIPHFFGGKLEGSVIVDGMDTRDTTVSELFPHVGLVLQNADAQLFNGTVEDELAFGLESLGLSPDRISEKIRETAKTFRIEHLLTRSPDRLSGGEKRMAGIASIYCLGPSVLVLDEPYANLDGEGAERVREALKTLHRKGLAVVVVEQRLDECLEDADRCVIMEQGKILHDGSPVHARTILSSAGLIPDYSECHAAKRSACGNGNRPFGNVQRSEPFVRIEHLSCDIDGKPILRNVSFTIGRGETVALVGKNGSGKTTLIKHLNGLYRPRTGGVFFDDKRIDERTPPQKASLAGISFQNPNDQFFKGCVEEELRVGLELAQGDREGWLERICEIFDLHDFLGRSPFRLSEGEKKRTAVCSVLSMDPRLLVLDEPTAGQDGRLRLTLAKIVRELNRKGRDHPRVHPRFRFRPGGGGPVDCFGKRRRGGGRSLGNNRTEYADGCGVGRSWEKTDPRTKLLICILVVAAVFAAQSFATVLSQSALIFTAVLILRQGRSFAQYMKLTMPMVGLVFVISLLSLNSSAAFLLAARLFNIFTASQLVFGYLTAEELSCALRHMKVPFVMVFMISTGLRFVPLMRKKIASVREAQMSRGIDLRFRLKNVGNFMAMLVPVLTQSLVLSDELAVAMEVRGFGMKDRSSRKKLRFRRTDYLLCAFSVLAFVAFAAWESGLYRFVM